MARARGARRAAPGRVLGGLGVLLLLLVVLPAVRAAGNGGGAAAGTPSGSTSAPPGETGNGDAPASGTGLPYGPGPQQRYAVHPADAPGSCHYRSRSGRPLPDPACTPGALNPTVTPATAGRTICRSGYSSGIRPPAAITDREKADSARAYGYRGSFRTAEYDHLVPLSLGGDPNDGRNLWAEPNDRAGATSTTNGKDAIEDRLHAAVCDHQVDLVAAQRAIATDWTTALVVLGLS